ncbi:MAG TPA: ABC transporter substrate-binding protein, partial [Terrimicrobiaceae bacterium]|nr:ABC transporter substrate-binding protein [Terrimicrobiaceae bacterium]
MKWTSLLPVVWIAIAALTGCQRKPVGEVLAESVTPLPLETPAAQTQPSPEPSPSPELSPSPEPLKLPETPADPLATRVGLFVPLTGPQASFGLDAVSGAKLAVEEINAATGVLGHPINLIVKDTESQTEKVAPVVTELIDTEKVAALIGEIATDRSLVAAPIAQERGIPMITPGATNEKVTATGNYIFRTCYTDAF